MTIIKIDKTQAELVCELFDQYRVFYNQKSDTDRANQAYSCSVADKR